MKSTFETKSADKSQVNNLSFQVNQMPAELLTTSTVIQVRELNKRYTHANLKLGKCTLDCCSNNSSHWLTRQNTDYCQSDMICNQHAQMWMQVRDLVASENGNE